MVVKHFEVYLVNLDPTLCSEMQKTRPYLIISPENQKEIISTLVEMFSK